MIVHFYDSSSFVKLFVREAGTPEMLRLYATVDRRVVSRIVFVEVHSAIVRLEREGIISSPDADPSRPLLKLEANRLTVAEVTVDVVSTAQALLSQHKLRSMDAIQLASAMQVGTPSLTTFVVSDNRLKTAALTEGFRTVDPTGMQVAP
jgi:predicted nucleic acid-binding protein